MPSDNAPFYAGSIITNPKYFVGYEHQLDTITNRAVSVQCTSINVVGEKRIGKSSLLYHFCQTYQERIQSRGKNPRDYLAIYISFEQGNCQRKSSFYHVVAAELSNNLQKRYSWFGQPRKLIQALQDNNFNTESFYAAIEKFRDIGLLPILCLDKFETLFKHPQEFNNGFYDNLRSLMDNHGLMLVIASEKDIRIYSRQKKLTSSFFNLGEVMKLEGFSENEARDLVRLPHSTISSSEAVLNENEQQFALEWGGRNPYLLQLAGLYLWEGQQTRQNLDSIKKRFDRQAKGISANHNIWRKSFLALKWLFWRLPVKLGQVGRFVGTNLGDIGDAIVGWALILITIFVVLKIVPPKSIIEAVKNLLGL